MKLGIITFQFAYNYGAQLQAYALKYYLESIGYNVEIINYIPSNFLDEYSINKGIVYNLRHIKNWIKKRNQRNLFRLFNVKFMGLSNRIISRSKELEAYLRKFDAVIYGSDQIWNGSITQNNDVYFGNSNPGIKKISYAASFGSESLTEFQENCIKQYLKGFHAVSVREKQSEVLINSILKDVKVVTVVDPIFLLNREQWNGCIKRMKSVLDVNKKYILLYSLNADTQLKEIATQYAKDNDLEIINVHPDNNHQIKCGTICNDCGPLEFLFLLKNAEIIVTNSFHAISFSSIFNKKVLIGRMNYSNRVINLFSYFKLNIDFQENTIVDFKKLCTDNIESLIVDSKRYISNSLSVRE